MDPSLGALLVGEVLLNTALKMTLDATDRLPRPEHDRFRRRREIHEPLEATIPVREP
jgi:hypothetical protein